MEDASTELALATPDRLEILDARIASLEAAASDLAALAAASRALFRMNGRSG